MPVLLVLFVLDSCVRGALRLGGEYHAAGLGCDFLFLVTCLVFFFCAHVDPVLALWQLVLSMLGSLRGHTRRQGGYSLTDERALMMHDEMIAWSKRAARP